MKQSRIVTDIQQGCRLDKFLHEQAPELSRNRIQELIKNDWVKINGSHGKNNTRLKADDEVTWEIPPQAPLEVLPEAIPLTICYEDEDVIVVNKPKGMVVHPSAGHMSGTLVNALLAHCDDLSGINGVLRPGIVHRIDKDTTGLLVVAKNDAAHRELVRQLQEKSVQRLYYALVHGIIAHEYGTIDAPIGRDEKDRQKMAVTEKGKAACTHFHVLERFPEFTFIECRLDTGRTHQIRVHMQYIHHPVAGDPKYSYRKPFGSDGQLLHAHQLSFIHPRTKEKITVNAPLPPDFEAVLAALRSEMR